MSYSKALFSESTVNINTISSYSDDSSYYWLIYIDGTNGMDINNGDTEDKPVQTIDRAYEIGYNCLKLTPKCKNIVFYFEKGEYILTPFLPKEKKDLSIYSSVKNTNDIHVYYMSRYGVRDTKLILNTNFEDYTSTGYNTSKGIYFYNLSIFIKEQGHLTFVDFYSNYEPDYYFNFYRCFFDCEKTYNGIFINKVENKNPQHYTVFRPYFYNCVFSDNWQEKVQSDKLKEKIAKVFYKEIELNPNFLTAKIVFSIEKCIGIGIPLYRKMDQINRNLITKWITDYSFESIFYNQEYGLDGSRGSNARINTILESPENTLIDNNVFKSQKVANLLTPENDAHLPIVIYVDAKNGSDENSGQTKEKAIKTLKAAFKRMNDVNVANKSLKACFYLAEGDYIWEPLIDDYYKNGKGAYDWYKEGFPHTISEVHFMGQGKLTKIIVNKEVVTNFYRTNNESNSSTSYYYYYKSQYFTFYNMQIYFDTNGLINLQPIGNYYNYYSFYNIYFDCNKDYEKTFIVFNYNHKWKQCYNSSYRNYCYRALDLHYCTTSPNWEKCLPTIEKIKQSDELIKSYYDYHQVTLSKTIGKFITTESYIMDSSYLNNVIRDQLSRGSIAEWIDDYKPKSEMYGKYWGVYGNYNENIIRYPSWDDEEVIKELEEKKKKEQAKTQVLIEEKNKKIQEENVQIEQYMAKWIAEYNKKLEELKEQQRTEEERKKKEEEEKQKEIAIIKKEELDIKKEDNYFLTLNTPNVKPFEIKDENELIKVLFTPLIKGNFILTRSMDLSLYKIQSPEHFVIKDINIDLNGFAISFPNVFGVYSENNVGDSFYYQMQNCVFQNGYILFTKLYNAPYYHFFNIVANSTVIFNNIVFKLGFKKNSYIRTNAYAMYGYFKIDEQANLTLKNVKFDSDKSADTSGLNGSSLSDILYSSMNYIFYSTSSSNYNIQSSHFQNILINLDVLPNYEVSYIFRSTAPNSVKWFQYKRKDENENKSYNKIKYSDIKKIETFEDWENPDYSPFSKTWVFQEGEEPMLAFEVEESYFFDYGDNEYYYYDWNNEELVKVDRSTKYGTSKAYLSLMDSIDWQKIQSKGPCKLVQKRIADTFFKKESQELQTNKIEEHDYGTIYETPIDWSNIGYIQSISVAFEKPKESTEETHQSE